jgi:pimeloyl-ACP methyl ester carboxylesterase
MPTIFYRKLGKGYPVILIHGFCETHETWNGFAEKLAEKFEVLAVDLPGFGESPMLHPPFSIEDVASETAEWIDNEKIKLPIVIGHSLGGYVTLAMAKKFPEKLAGIGLFQSTAYPDSEERKINRNRVIDFVETHGTGPFIDTFVPGLFLDKKHPAIAEAHRIARRTRKETLVAYAVAMRDRPSSIDFMEDYKKPMLVLGGDQDPIVTPEITQQLGLLSQNAETHLIKKIAHMAMY